MLLLSPVPSPDHVPEFCAVSCRCILVNPDVAANEVYCPDPQKKDEVALTKNALDRIAAAAGIS